MQNGTQKEIDINYINYPLKILNTIFPYKINKITNVILKKIYL